ncbi:MAG: M48 family metallopeptidase [Hyphomicrobiaceae bacterium]
MHSDHPSPTYPAILSDGQSAEGHEVAVTFGPDGVIVIEHDLSQHTLPYATLGAAEPLSRHSQDVLLTATAFAGLTLFVGDRGFVAELANRAAHLRAGTERWRAARIWVAAGVGLFALAAWMWWAGIGPASTLARFMPDAVRDRIGRQVIVSLSNDRQACNLPAGRAALDKLTARLTQATDADSRFKVVVVDWSLVNAFATPGEQIALTRGILQNAKSADEVAGVLAHEMGHGLERHPETALIRVVGLSAALEFMMGGSGGSLANIGLLLAQLQYTRLAEQEADDHALRILKRAGIAPRGLGDFFKRMDGRRATDPVKEVVGGIDVLRTHPQSAERAKRAHEQPAYPATPALDDAEWQALRNICPIKTTPPAKVE